MSMPEWAVAMDGVSKVYGHAELAVVALHDVSLHVAAGEVVLVMGPSGSGKSTLLSMLGGLLAPSSGEICLAGQSLSGLSSPAKADLRLRQVGFVFQNFQLLTALTTLDNVALPRALAGASMPAARARALDLLCGLGLEHRASYRPAQLSGGEQQRVAIARALVNEPVLLLADEPTANLDARAGHQTVELLIGARGERTVIIVSHDQRIADLATRVVHLEDGRLRDGRAG